MKTVRIREEIKAFLAEGPKDTGEILEHINGFNWGGTTSQQLGNVLSNDKDIVKVGYTIFATREWVSDNHPEWIEFGVVAKVEGGNQAFCSKCGVQLSIRLLREGRSECSGCDDEYFEWFYEGEDERLTEEEMRRLYSKIGINYNQVSIGDK